MVDNTAYYIFKNIVICILLAVCCITATFCVALHFWEGDWNWADCWPVAVLLGRSANYIFGAVQYSIMLKKIKRLEE